MAQSYAIVLAVVAAGALGCSGATTLKDEPISVSGKVVKGGQSVRDVIVSFHPLDHGHPQSLPVATDGTFHGELIGGSYAYYVEKTNAPSSVAALKKIDPKYYQPDLGRIVNVEFGKDIILALD